MEVRFMSGHLFYRNIILFLGCTLMWSVGLRAQGVFAQAITKDAHPVVQVAIELYDLNAKKIVDFGLTDIHGNVQLDAKPGHYLLEAKHLSYAPVSLDIEIKSGVDTVICRMLPKSVELGEILVQDKMGMGQQKGDTISYNLKAFVNGNEEKLKDVINKLPGMEVTETGDVKVNGKVVDELLIDGKEFFGDNQKAATDNINAEMLEGIDLLNDYESFNPVKEIEGSDKTAVNIRLKEEFKGKVVGSVEALGGHRDAYQVHSNLFSFSRKFNVSGLFDINNINAQTISLTDYLSMTKGVQRDIRADRRSVSPFGEIGDLPDFLLSDDHAEKKSVEFGALNFAIYPNKQLKINGFSTLNYLSLKEKIQSNKYFDASLPIRDYGESTRSDGHFLFNQTRLNVEYLPNRNTLLNYSVRWNPNHNKQEREVTSSLLDSMTNSQITEHKKGHKNVLGQQVSFIKRIKRLSLLSFSVYHEFKQTERKYAVQTSDSLFAFDYDHIHQDDRLHSNEFGAIVKYSKKIHRDLFRFAVGYDGRSDNFYLNSNFNTDSVVDMKYKLSKPYSFLSMERSKGFFQYKLKMQLKGFELIHHLQSGRQLFLAPSARIKFSFKPTHELSIFYDRSAESPSITKISPQRYVTDYKNYSVGSQNLFDEIAVRNMVALNYLLIDLFNGILIYANSSYAVYSNPLGTNIWGSQDFYRKEYAIINRKERWNGMVNTEWRVSKLKSKLKIQLSYTGLQQSGLIDGQSNLMNSQFFSWKLGILSLAKKSKLSYDFGIEHRIQLVTNSLLSTQTKANSWMPYLDLSGVLGKRIHYYLDNRFSYYSTATQIKKLTEMDAKIVYKQKKSPFRFWFVAYDMLNLGKTTFVEQSANAYQVSLDSYSRLPGYLGLGVGYEW